MLTKIKLTMTTGLTVFRTVRFITVTLEKGTFLVSVITQDYRTEKFKHIKHVDILDSFKDKSLDE